MATNFVKPSVIYVDDEKINLFLFKEMFKNDYEIHTVESAVEALTYLKDHKVDLVVTDHMMPVMTGLDFLKKLQEKYPANYPKRVMLSGFIKENEVEKALQDHIMHRFVKKPWTYDKLKPILLEVTRTV